jgi:YD repeat-containing protein
VSFGYDAANRRTTLGLPNGVSAAYAYDPASQLIGITYTLGSTVIGDLTYAYDDAGQRIAVAGSLARTGLPTAMSSATYDAANQITNGDGTSFSYDANGSLTGDGVSTYTWNVRNQLVGMSASSASFAHDAFGRRRSKTVSGSTTNFLYDGRNAVQELAGGNPSANLLTGLSLDETFTRTDSGGVRNFLADGVGSTLELGDGSGALQTHYLYEPFGGTSTSAAQAPIRCSLPVAKTTAPGCTSIGRDSTVPGCSGLLPKIRLDSGAGPPTCTRTWEQSTSIHESARADGPCMGQQCADIG